MNTITLRYEEQILEISQAQESHTLNVDVLNVDEELMHCFEIDINELGELLNDFQVRNNII